MGEYNLNQPRLRTPLTARQILGMLAGMALAGSAVLAQTPPAPGEWNKILAGAKSEGKVVLYTGMVASTTDRLKADFEAAYPGIAFVSSRIVGSAILPRLEQERKSAADGADVTINVETVWLEERAKENALRAPIGPSAAAWPRQYMLSNVIPVLSLEPFVIAYNTNLVKTPVTGYADFLRPEFKGRKFAAPILSSTALIAWFDWLEKTQGSAFFNAFAAQEPRHYTSSIPGTQAVASGEVLAAILSTPASIFPLTAQGAPVKMVVPMPSLGFRWGGALLGWGKRPNASYVFMDYLMSPRGQAAWNGRGDSASPLPNVKGSLDAKSIDPFEPAKYTPDVVKAYTEKWNRLFTGR